MRQRLERERLVLMAEGIPATITRTDGAGSRARRTGTIAAIALSQQRLAVYGMGAALVDVTWDSGDAADLDVAASDDGLTVAFDAQRFGHDQPGRVELLLRIGDARALRDAIDQRRRPLEPRRYRPS